jgi:hypothetical protein
LRELRGLAAGRGADVHHTLAGDVAEQACRQRGGVMSGDEYQRCPPLP